MMHACKCKKLFVSLVLSVLFVNILVLWVCNEYLFNYDKSFCSSAVPNDGKNSKNLHKLMENFQNHAGIEDNWKMVTNEIFVYSAYFDQRYPGRLRLIGAVTNISVKAACIVQYNRPDEGPRVLQFNATVANINEHYFGRYTAAYFICYTCRTDIPSLVSLADASDTSLHSDPVRIHVINNSDTGNQRMFTMCVSPVHGYINHSGLIEWMELNLLLGVEKFIFYFIQAPEQTQNVLKYYESRGIVEILKWSISHLDFFSNVHYHGQLAAINDCLYRHKGKSRYLAVIDLDEFIIPQKVHHFTWKDMIQSIPDKSVYMFRNAFFNKFPNINVALKIDIFSRRKLINGAKDRSKMIVKPDDVVTLGIHEPWALRRGSTCHVVNPNTGLLHHYKDSTDTSTRFVHHMSAFKYRQKLLKKIDQFLDNSKIQPDHL